MSALARYRPSGRSSVRLIPMGLLAIAVGIGLAWPYQALVTWVPFIYINAVVYVVFAALLGGGVYLASALGKNRNRWLGAVLGIVVAVSAAGASHYFAYRGAVNDVIEEVAPASEAERAEIEKQLTFGMYVDLRVEAGWSLGRRSSTGSGDLTGVFVWLIWGIELLGLLGAAVYGGIRVTPYCEKCSATLEEEELFVRDDLDLADIGILMHAQSAAALIEIPPRPDVNPIGLRVTYACHACKTCDGDAYLTITQHTPAQSSDGDDTDEELHSQVTLSRAELERLLALRQELTGAPPRQA
jgi:hypothetical protein